MRYLDISTPLLVSALFVSGCGGDPEPTSGAEGCAEGEVMLSGECRESPFRYEPETRLDTDNVMYYSDEPLELLDLPAPPKSGFRIIMEPQWVEPGEDFYPCQAWAIPDDLANDWIYTAVLHTTPGLHHANLYGIEVNAEEGPNPYPGCRQRADGQVFGQIGGLLTGDPISNLNAPDVLFANSTQVIGSESYALPPGYAYQVKRGGEVTTDVHLQNTTSKRIRVEAAWDFYTMPKELVQKEVAMFVNIWLDFNIPARSQKTLSATCGWDGGEVVAVMPHTHQWATGFDLKYGTANAYDEGLLAGEPEVGDLVDTMVTPYDRQGTGSSESDIEVYDPTVPTDGANALQFQCHYDNPTDADMCNGFAGHEMCFLFGYVSPPQKQRVAVVPAEGAPCISFNPNTVEPDKTFSIAEYFSQAPAEVRPRLFELYGGGDTNFFGGCK